MQPLSQMGGGKSWVWIYDNLGGSQIKVHKIDIWIFNDNTVLQYTVVSLVFIEYILTGTTSKYHGFSLFS